MDTALPDHPTLPVRTGTEAFRALRTDGARLLRRIDELGRIGADPLGGVTRPAFGADDRRAQRYLRAEAAAAGLRTEVDPAGNVVIRQAHAQVPGPVVLMGSHLDTVINGGRLDGAYGVLAALEVMQTVADAGVELAHTPVAVAFANEEGALFPQPFWGSMALTGQTRRLPDDPRDRHGNPLAGPLRQAGGDLTQLSRAAWPPHSVRAYLELHIEQGPVLEELNLPIGVVTDIVGRVVHDIRVLGRAGHAGTTPMGSRRDAAVAMSHIVIAAERTAAAGRCRVATAGCVTVSPGATNVIPNEAVLSVEFRDESPARLADAAASFLADLRTVSELTGCEILAEETLRTVPVPTDPGLQDLIASCADGLGHGHTRLPSGAGHDAQIVAAVAPTGMIFVPSLKGLSHTPEEDTAPADLVAGADVLLRAALALGSGHP
ncbi:Zn-dependent hydrolase [Streptomyces castrisilvae]|uniref:Zn-dependent hydrolase n=1 Tax=Streptomyces castrisilvae TaxID=3033811 RepID=A0ABY9HCN8_9ACTN|nr:Zn-dependent hydrolase [Streptomyces sp. Mut1]WLQ32273.1 Zn-dependent hydrolase [Streptomyces sp. Mut1]